MKPSRPVILITMGDPCGIGPEVVARALAEPEVFRLCRPVVVGSAAVMREAVELAKAPLEVRLREAIEDGGAAEGVVDVLDPQNLDPMAVTPGRVSAAAGKASVEWVLTAGELLLANRAHAMATAPINKEAASAAGYRDIGHMELLQRLTGAPQVATMLMSGRLRVVHLTTHRSLRRACEAVTKDNVLAMLRLTHGFFQLHGLPAPRIGVAALNPHASDGGLLGDEEEREIAPAVAAARGEDIDATGPVPADTVFPQAIGGRYDVVLCLYHDQGHIPVKVHGWEQSISLILGLPFIRTSVDHGTAFDIAGKGVADGRSMGMAIRVAAALASGKGLRQ